MAAPLANPRDLFSVLGVDRQAPFATLKKAYYRRAKECHPDLFQGDREKEEEFKQLVHAFDVLSDPGKRRRYEAHLAEQEARREEMAAPDGVAAPAAPVGPGGRRGPAAAPQDEGWDVGPIGDSIMDTPADDTLEELIVGVHIPRDITLQTFMRDLERTTNFMLFREGKNYFALGQYHLALAAFRMATERGPQNILYHYFLGEAAARLAKYGLADREYRQCLRLGAARFPPQHLARVRQSLYQLRQHHGGVLGRLSNLVLGAPSDSFVNEEEKMIAAHARDMDKLLRRRLRPDDSRPQLPPPK